MIDPLKGLDEPALPRIRAEHGPFESDEDLLLFLFLNPAAYNNFKREKKPITWNPRRCPVTALVKELANRGDLASIEVERGPLKLALSGSLGSSDKMLETFPAIATPPSGTVPGHREAPV